MENGDNRCSHFPLTLELSFGSNVECGRMPFSGHQNGGLGTLLLDTACLRQWTHRSNFPYFLQSRRELLSWLQQNAASLAGAYEGAVKLLESPAFPARIHFISHAVRDISDRLVFVLDPQLQAKRVGYEDAMDKIQKMWTTPDGICNSEPDGTVKVLIDRRVARRLGSLVEQHRERRRRPSSSELLFRYLMRGELTGADVNRRLVKDFKLLQDWFMSKTHLRRDQEAKVDEAEFHTKFIQFESVLYSFVGSFFVTKVEIDEILQKANG